MWRLIEIDANRQNTQHCSSGFVEFELAAIEVNGIKGGFKIKPEIAGGCGVLHERSTRALEVGMGRSSAGASSLSLRSYS